MRYLTWELHPILKFKEFYNLLLQTSGQESFQRPENKGSHTVPES